MLGQMQHHPLMISSLLAHASRNHSSSGILSLERDGTGATSGTVNKTGYGQIAKRAAQMAHALTGLGVQRGDRIATIAWNDQRHFELYYAISGIGAVCHTINPRLFSEQLTYIIRHAEDKLIFIDPTLLPVLEGILDTIADVPEKIIVMSDAVPETPITERLECVAYETLITNEAETFDWPVFDENTASSLCYTSGTTGNPKGVLYSHRSTVLHSYAIALPEAVAMNPSSIILPVVPMFHVNAWGTVYGSAMTGANLAMPGPRLDGQSLYELIMAAGVTYLCGVPTIWMGLLEYLRHSSNKLPPNIGGLAGGSALPPALTRAYFEEQGLLIEHGWGMTELSPIGAYNRPLNNTPDMPTDDIVASVAKQGRAPYGIELKIIDDDDNDMPRDGKAVGELVARGPWVTSGYYNDDAANEAAFTADGWFRTGDVATIDAGGYIELVDRVKDLIKSGGEWISSIDLENLALTMPGIKEAAAVPARHAKWDERPLLIAVKEPAAPIDAEAVRTHLGKTLANWMLPDAVIFVDELPHTATGKIMKRALREEYADYLERIGSNGQ